MRFLTPLIWLFISFSAFGADLKIEATVTRWSGEASVGGKPAAIGMIVPVGTEVRAGDKSFVEFKLSSGHTMRLEHGKMVVRALPGAKPQSLFELASGRIYSFVQKLRSGEEVNIFTRSGIMGVRGTKYMVDETGEKTYICVCEGTVSVQNPHGTASIAAGEDMDLYGDKKPATKPASDQMFNMVADVFTDMGYPVARKK